jgi:hypothetical protein
MDIAYQKRHGSSNSESPPQKETKNQKLPTIQCSCGATILIVPDLAAMNRALKQHKAEHREVDEGKLVEKIIEEIANIE